MLRGVVFGLLLSPLLLLGLALLGAFADHPGWFWWPIGIIAGLAVLAMIVAYITSPSPPQRPPRDTGPRDTVPRDIRPRDTGPRDVAPDFRPEPGNHAEHLRLKRIAARWRFGPPQ